VLTDVVSV